MLGIHYSNLGIKNLLQPFAKFMTSEQKTIDFGISYNI